MWSSVRSQLREKADRIAERIQPWKQRALRVPAVEIVVRTIQELGADDASHMAAGVSYYAVLSLFPLLLGLIAIFGLFLPGEEVQEKLFEFFERNLPGAIDELERNIEDVIRLRGAIGGLSLVLLLWSASSMFSALGRAINRAWDVHRDRPFYIRKLRDLTMAIGVGVLFLLSMGATSVFSILRTWDLPFVSGAADIGARLLALAFSLGIFLVLYKFMPNTKTYWRYIWPGAVLAAVLFEVAKALFVFYLDAFASYESIYGSVASVIVLLVWVYISAFILILGAEFSAEYGRMRMGVARGVLLVDHVIDTGRDDDERSVETEDTEAR